MKWPWTRVQSGPSVPEGDAAQAKDAKRKALAAVEDADEKWPEVCRVAESLRELRRANHFAEALHRSYQLRHGSKR